MTDSPSDSKSVVRVVIANAHGDDNRGSAALNAAAIAAAMQLGAYVEVHIVSVTRGESLKEAFRHTLAAFPEVHLHGPPVAVKNGRYAGTRSIINQIWLLVIPRPKRLPSSLAAIQNADLVLSRGGYILYGRDTFRSNFGLFSSFFPMLYAHRIGKVTATMPTSVGPLARGKVGSIVLAWILRRLGLVITRDPLSYSVALELGVGEGRLVQLPDSVFSLSWDGPRNPSQNYAALTERAATRRTPSATDLLVRVGALLLRSGDVDECVGVPQVHGEYSDLPATQGVIDRISCEGAGGTRLIDGDLSVQQLMSVYGAARVTVSHHLHACVLSMIAGTPAVAISTDGAKIEGLYESLGLPPSWVVKPDADAEFVAFVVIDAIGRRDEVGLAVARAKEKLDNDLVRILLSVIA